MRIDIDGKGFETQEDRVWISDPAETVDPPSLVCDREYILILEAEIDEANERIQELTKANVTLYRQANEPWMKTLRARGYWKRLWLTIIGRLK